MGCGSSTAGGSMSKDPEDFTLEHLEFKPMKVPAFDTYLCEEVQPAVNQVVDICNDFNGAIDEIKEACAIVCGGFIVDVATGKERDTVIVQLTKGDGSQPSAEELATLSADVKVTDADAKLAKARSALHKATESSYVALKVEGDVLAADGQAPKELGAFNTALGELRAAIGGNKVAVSVKTAGTPGAACVRAEVQKPVFPKGSDKYSMVPVGVVDVAKSQESRAQIAAEGTLADALAGLTRAVKTAEAAGASVSFSLKRKKLVASISGGEGDDAASAKATVRKATTAANSQLFKLYKSARNSAGIVNITKALVSLIDVVKKKLEELITGTGKQVKDILSINPKIDFTLDGDVTFDFGLKVDLPDYSNLDAMGVLNKLLPGAAKLLLDSILKLKDRLIEIIPQFKELAEKIEELVSKAGEVFEDPGEKIKEAFVDGENSDPFAIPKAVAAATGNARTVAVEPVKIVKVFKDTVVRVGTELANGVTEIKAMLPA